jgi:hypothetical protein
MPAIRYGKSPSGDTISGTTTINGNIGWKTTPLMIWKENQVKEASINLFERELVKLGIAVSEDDKVRLRNDLDSEVKRKSEGPMTAGTILHYLIECDLKGTKPDLSQYPKELIDLAETGFLNYLEWKGNVKFKVHRVEISIIHKELWYGSTLDCTAFINNKLSSFDWKLASSIYEDYLIQIESYRQNWNYNFPSEPLLGMHLLKIDKKNAAYTHHYWDQCPEAWEAFLCGLKLHGLHKVLKKMV